MKQYSESKAPRLAEKNVKGFFAGCLARGLDYYENHIRFFDMKDCGFRF